MMKKFFGILLIFGVGLVLVACEVARATKAPPFECECAPVVTYMMCDEFEPDESEASIKEEKLALAHYEQLVEPEVFEEVPEEAEDFTDALNSFGETIAAAGVFWEEWWHLTGRFGSENIDYEAEVPAHLAGFNRLLPTAGFANLAHLRVYLTNYFTDAWVATALFSSGAVFAQYHDYLYIYTTRTESLRPDWTTAKHELTAKEGNSATVATRVSAGTWQPELTNPADVTFTFGLLNGRIDTNSPRLIRFEMPY